MGGAGRRLSSSESTRRPPARGTCCVLLVITLCAQLIVTHVATGSTLCDRCETDEIRALRRYYLSLNLPSVFNDIVALAENAKITLSFVCQDACPP